MYFGLKNLRRVICLVILACFFCQSACTKAVRIGEPDRYSWQSAILKSDNHKPWLKVIKVEGDSVFCEIPYKSESSEGSLIVTVHKNSIRQVVKEHKRMHPVGVFFTGGAIGTALITALYWYS